MIVAHRGGSLEAPENTVASVRHGVRSGADWVEVDVRLSRDGDAVVIHDDTTDRTTDAPGLVAEQSTTALLKLPAGRPRPAPTTAATLAAQHVSVPDFGDRFVSERVPRLDDVLAVDDVRLMIELKQTARPRELVDRVVAAIHRAGAADRVALGSFEFDLLDIARSREPSLPLVGIAEDPAGIDAMLQLPISVLAVSVAMVEEALRRAPPHVAVWAWTLYSTEQAIEVANLGVHGLITDVPAALVERLRTPGVPLQR